MKYYYCVIQFFPRPSRYEGVNVGVALFGLNGRSSIRASADRKFLFDHFEMPFTWTQFSIGFQGFLHRIEIERFRSLAALRKFILSHANNFRMTEPMPIRVKNPEEEIEQLFAELVKRKEG